MLNAQGIVCYSWKNNNTQRGRQRGHVFHEQFVGTRLHVLRSLMSVATWENDVDMHSNACCFYSKQYMASGFIAKELLSKFSCQEISL